MPIPPELNGKKVRAAVTVVLFEDDSVGLDLHGAPSMVLAHAVVSKGARWIEQAELASVVVAKLQEAMTPAVALAQDVSPQMDAFMARLKQRP